jgi:phage gp16-like protein
MTRSTLIKRIHVLKRDLNLDDDTYRSILASIADGKTSCKDIDLEYLNLVYIALERLAQKMVQSRITRNDRLQKKIAKLGYLLGWNWQAIANFIKRETGGRHISTRSCNALELTKVINGMVSIIDDRLSTGELKLSEKDIKDFLKNTQTHKEAV